MGYVMRTIMSDVAVFFISVKLRYVQYLIYIFHGFCFCWCIKTQKQRGDLCKARQEIMWWFIVHCRPQGNIKGH